MRRARKRTPLAVLRGGVPLRQGATPPSHTENVAEPAQPTVRRITNWRPGVDVFRIMTAGEVIIVELPARLCSDDVYAIVWELAFYCNLRHAAPSLPPVPPPPPRPTLVR